VEGGETQQASARCWAPSSRGRSWRHPGTRAAHGCARCQTATVPVRLSARSLRAAGARPERRRVSTGLPRGSCSHPSQTGCASTRTPRPAPERATPVVVNGFRYLGPKTYRGVGPAGGPGFTGRAAAALGDAQRDARTDRGVVRAYPAIHGGRVPRAAGADDIDPHGRRVLAAPRAEPRGRDGRGAGPPREPAARGGHPGRSGERGPAAAACPGPSGAEATRLLSPGPPATP
jgi:hypothetical protein